GRHTRFSRDWSSDVCSSDLGANSTRALAAMAAICVGWAVWPADAVSDTAGPAAGWEEPGTAGRWSSVCVLGGGGATKRACSLVCGANPEGSTPEFVQPAVARRIAPKAAVRISRLILCCLPETAYPTGR